MTPPAEARALADAARQRGQEPATPTELSRVEAKSPEPRSLVWVGDVVLYTMRSGVEWPADVLRVGPDDTLDLVVKHAPRPPQLSTSFYAPAVPRARSTPSDVPTWRPRDGRPPARD